MLNSFHYYRLSVLCLSFLFLSSLSYGQIEKKWPVWAMSNATEFVGDKYTATNTSTVLKYTYTGVDNFSFGFYSNNTALSGPTGFRFGVSFASGGIGVYVHNALYSGTALSLTTGDVLEIKYSNDRFTLLRNGVEVYVYNNSGANQSYFLYPYFQDNSGTGLEGGMSWHVETVANYNPPWYSSGSWRIAKNVLERGEDGGVEIKYTGASASSYRQVRFQAAKNTNYSSYCVARFYFRPSNRYLYMAARNPNYGHKQTGSWSSTSMYLTTAEMYAGAKVRMAREGSNIVFYVNGKEKKRFNTDANIDLHPIMYRYSAGQENDVRTTFKEGGMCQNYFNSSAYPIQSDIDNYYDEAVEESRNYMHTKTYNGEGEQVCHLIGENRIYHDEMGRSTQNQTKDMVYDQVWASETLYDEYGRSAIATLSAPTGTSAIQYKSNFVLDTDGNPYGHNDFTGSKLNSPNEVGEQNNTLGWWYSTNNYWDEWQATTDYPYTRTEYSKITGSRRRIAGPGNTFRMGSGHEETSFNLQVGTELNYVYANKHPLCRLAANSDYDAGYAINSFCNSNTFEPKYNKVVTVDAEGEETVVFADREGRVVAKAASGKTSSSTTDLKNTQFVIAPKDFRDIHITKRSSYTTTVTFSGSSKNYSIYNLKTDLLEGSSTGSTYALSAGFYRIVNNNASSTLTLDYQVNYYDFSLEIYNLSGQMVASVAPDDVVYNQSNPYHSAYTFYRYNSLGYMIWEQSPDAGRVDYFIRNDGKIRFSQNAVQLASNRYNYTKYDISGRIVEVGESTSIPSGGLQSQINNRYYPTSGNSNQTYSLYDIVDAGFSVSGYTQTFTVGRLSKVWNTNETIWYSYDEFGRINWTARQVNGVGLAVKVTEYIYDLNGAVTQVIYQKNQSDEFRHQYAYNVNSQLKSVGSRQDGAVNSPAVDQVKYEYARDGGLTRTLIGGGLETQTFAYTLEGELKAINPEDMRVTDIDGGGQHPFSLALHYYLNDFKPANGQWKETYNLPTTSTTSTSYNSFIGNITAARWKTRAVNGAADYSGHFAYRYRYNDFNELKYANFANITPYSNSTYEGRATYISDYFNYVSYDKNGNIYRNLRRAANIFVCSGNSLYMDNLYYRYDYSNGKNRLTRIDDNYSNNCIPGELTDQDTNNYGYDLNGQMITDVQENHFIEYDGFGRTIRVRNGLTASSPLKTEYFYGPDGKRVRKTEYQGGSWISTWYIFNDASLQAVYESSNACGGCINPSLAEVPLYGNGKIGLAYVGSGLNYQYELTDHLGNVRAVIAEGNYGLTDVVSYADYYPHGWELPGRHFESSNDYRYGYQGRYAEEDNNTGWNLFELRSMDTRIGRWMTVDPYNQYYSPYLAMGNDPISGVDPDGGKKVYYNTDGTWSHTTHNTFLHNLFNGTQYHWGGKRLGRDDFWSMQDITGECLCARQYVGFIKPGPDPNNWEKLNNSGFLGSMAYGVVNDINIMRQLPFTGRGSPVYNLDRTSLVKGSWDAQLSGISGLTTFIPIGKGYQMGVKAISPGVTMNVGKRYLSLGTKVSAPGMSGRAIIHYKHGSKQIGLHYHNWVVRSAKDTNKGFGPITQKFWHYHFGKGKAGKVHRQLFSGDKILESSQLRKSIFGWY